jgi:hypothetical protein
MSSDMMKSTFRFPDLDAARTIDGIDAAAEATATVSRNSRRDQRLEFDPFTIVNVSVRPQTARNPERQSVARREKGKGEAMAQGDRRSRKRDCNSS